MTYYNWENILKTKSINELLEFLNNSNIDIEGKLIALTELDKRKFDKKKLIQFGDDMLNERILIKEELNNETLREQFVKYMPYATAALTLYCLLNFLFSRDYTISNFWVFGMVLFITGGISSRIELKSLQKSRHKKTEENEKIIERITTYNK